MGKHEGEKMILVATRRRLTGQMRLQLNEGEERRECLPFGGKD